MPDVYTPLPTVQLAALQLYIQHGYSSGHFLTAVLENDLAEAVARADAANQGLLAAYVYWLYNYAPADCWGAPEKVEAWIAHRRAERVALAAEVVRAAEEGGPHADCPQ